MRTKLIAAMLVASGFASSAGAVTVFSEDFESYSAGPGSPGYLTYVGGPVPTADVFGPWWVRGSVDMIVGDYGAIDGKSVDVAGTPGTALDGFGRYFDTTPGLTYTVTFDHSKNGAGLPLTVYFGDGLLPASPTTYAAPGAETTRTLSYVATGTLGGLGFASETCCSNSGSVVDNIVVTAVPEPGSVAMMMAGLGMLGLLARRRRRAD